MFGIYSAASVSKMVDGLYDAMDAGNVFSKGGKKASIETFMADIDYAALGRVWSKIASKHSKADWLKVASHLDGITTAANAGKVADFIRGKFAGSKIVEVR